MRVTATASAAVERGTGFDGRRYHVEQIGDAASDLHLA